jgi:p-hydroxybenzoate 3-monooxygenase
VEHAWTATSSPAATASTACAAPACRRPRAITLHEKVYPFGWLGVLADVPPVHHELIYGHTERGFMLASMRSHTRSRYYVQCSLTTRWSTGPTTRFYDEFRRRLPAEDAATLVTGPSIEKSIAPLRSFVAEPMRFGRLFLAGDAAPHRAAHRRQGPEPGRQRRGAAVARLAEHYRGSSAGIDSYSQRALARIWKAERFSWWFTSLMHQFPENGSFG